jgi:hypothetical protein
MATAPHFDQEAAMPETLTLDRPSTSRIFLKQRLVWVGGVMVLLLALAALAAPALTRLGWLRVPDTQYAAGLDEDGMPLGPSQWLRIPVGLDHYAGKNGALRGISAAKHTLLGESTFFQNLSRIILQTGLGKRIGGC